MTGEDVQFLASTAGRSKSSFFTLIFIVFLVLTSFNLKGQRKYDPGFITGTSYYLGDLNSSTHLAMPSFAIGPVLRYNLNARNSIRANVVYHRLSGQNLATDGYYSQVPVTNFNASFVDLGLQMEFNWWPYKTANRKTLMSPYVFAGLGYNLCLTNFTQSSVTVPFGLGYKINLGQWLSAGVEFGPRKTFDDEIDLVTNPASDAGFAPFGNKDWYVLTGVYFTYKIFKFWDTCPTYD